MAHAALAARVDCALRELEPYDLVGWRPGAWGVVVLPGQAACDLEALAANLCERAGLRLMQADFEGRRAWVVGAAEGVATVEPRGQAG